MAPSASKPVPRRVVPMEECDACGLLFTGGDVCPSCGSRVHHEAATEVEDAFDHRVIAADSDAPILPGESALESALEGIDGVSGDVFGPATSSNAPGPQSSLPFSLGGATTAAPRPNLPFGVGAPIRVMAAPAAAPEPAPAPAPVVVPEPEPEPAPVVVEEPPVLAATPVVEEPPVLAATPVAEEPPVLAATPVAEPETVLLSARLVEEASPSDDGMFQVRAQPVDNEVVYSMDEDVVVHDFGDELQVSEVIVDFDELVDPASQSVSFDPTLLSDGDPELFPARALPLDAAGDPVVETLAAEGFDALGGGRWKEAADRFRLICERRPGDAAALNDFGLSLLQLAIEVHAQRPTEAPAEEPHFQAAVLALRQAAQQNKHDSNLMFNLATALASCGRHTVATRIWDAAVALAPQDAAALNGRAGSLFALREFDAASKSLHLAATAAPEDALIERNLRRLNPVA